MESRPQCLNFSEERLIMNTNTTSTRVRAPATTGLQINALMTNNHTYDEFALNRSRRANSEQSNRRTQYFMKCKRKLNICSFNARTLGQSHSLGELCLDSKLKNIAITAIQEHRKCHTETIQVESVSEDYTLITSSATRNSRNASIHGVGFLFLNKYLNAITKVQKLSDRILRYLTDHWNCWATITGINQLSEILS